MTEADHADLSRRLALALGWPESSVVVAHGYCFIWLGRDGRDFDYRDPQVIWRVAERYRCFPTWNTQHNKWTVGKAAPRGRMPLIVFGDTAAEAVARAVVGARQC